MDQTEIANFVFLPYIHVSILFLLSEIYNVLRGIGKPYVMSLDSRLDLPPDPPSPMGRIAVIK